MQTAFSQSYLETPQGQEADRILRACVHCGFCTATCPTYLLTGNELDSPRGRIYLIKNLLEEGRVSRLTQTHLDRCLSCQSCETTCPSDVEYHTLLNIGRASIDAKVGRPLLQKLRRRVLRRSLQNPFRFRLLLGLGRLFRFLLPRSLKRQIPIKVKSPWPGTEHERKMLVLNGCVQGALSPRTNAATARVLDRLGIQVLRADREGCCGAIAFHLDAQEEGLQKARAQIDLLCQHLDAGVECIISTASGCGNFMQDYAALLQHDTAYAAKAERVVAHMQDIVEVLQQENLESLPPIDNRRLAFHCPCTLQHGLQLNGAVEALLQRLGFALTEVENGHLCCGSAGTYSILQPGMSRQLRDNKIAALTAGQPEQIVTANIGCQQHLGAATEIPVRHWIEVLDEALPQTG